MCVRRLVLNTVEFQGLMLQVAVRGHGVLLRGGRYDRLCTECAGVERVAAGMTIYLSRLLSCLHKPGAGQPPGWDSAKTNNGGVEVDVLVCRLTEDRIDEQMNVLGQLWQAGIRADASLQESQNLRGHVELAQSIGAQHLVVIRNDRVTIKQLNKSAGGRGNKKAQNDEEQVPITDVAKHFILRKGLTAMRSHGLLRCASK